MFQIGIQGGKVGVGTLIGQRDLPEEHVQDQNPRRPPDIDGLMAEGGYIAQAEEGPRNDVGEGGHKLHRAHPRQFSAGGEIGEQDTQKGSSGGRHSGIDQAVAKGAPLRAGQISPVFQRKCECAAGGVGEGGEQDHAVFQRHDSEKEHRGAPSQEGNGTGGGVGRGNSGVPSVHADALFLLHGAAVAVESRRCCGDHHDADSRSPSQIRGGDHLEVGLCGQDTKASANNDGRAEIRQIHGKEHQQNGEQCGTYQGKNHMPQGLPGRGAQIPGGEDQPGVQVVEGGEEHQCGKGDAPDDLEDDHAVPAVWVDAEPQELMSDDPSPAKEHDIGQRRDKRRGDHGQQKAAPDEGAAASPQCVYIQRDEEGEGHAAERREGGHKKAVPDQTRVFFGKKGLIVFQRKLSVPEQAGGHHGDDGIEDKEGYAGQHQEQEHTVQTGGRPVAQRGR